jgi:PIN domain nuclease of toxin-antitoxin system
MKLLLDTHVLLWAASAPERLPAKLRSLLNDAEHSLLFSTASLWEVAIKRNLGRKDFQVDARLLRRGLLDNSYNELPITSDHVLAIENLPPIHKDPFDRLLVAQATVEAVTLITVDPVVPDMPDPFERSRRKPLHTSEQKEGRRF